MRVLAGISAVVGGAIFVTFVNVPAGVVLLLLGLGLLVPLGLLRGTERDTEFFGGSDTFGDGP